jgi:hypothetical protein
VLTVVTLIQVLTPSSSTHSPVAVLERDGRPHLRHETKRQLVRGTSSCDDPALASYWAARRRKGIPRQMDAASLRLLQAQNGRCPLCGELLLDADRPPQTPREWEHWLAVTRKAMTRNAITAQPGGAPDEAKLASCTRTLLPATPTQQQTPSTSARQRAHGACLSRVHRNVHVRF